MISAELQEYLRHQGLFLKAFRCWQWLFTIGLQKGLTRLGLLIPIAFLVAVFLRNEKAIWTLCEVYFLYIILCYLVFIPKAVPWFLGRLRICRNQFVNKMLCIIHYCVRKDPSIGLACILERCRELKNSIPCVVYV